MTKGPETCRTQQVALHKYASRQLPDSVPAALRTSYSGVGGALVLSEIFFKMHWFGNIIRVAKVA
jgi:hypothetical protein